MWFRFFTLKYIEMNGHGFLISNFICIKNSSQFFKQWPGRGTRLGTQWGPSLLAKMHVYGKNILQNMMAHIWHEKYYVIEYQWFYHCACLCKATLVRGKPVGHFCSGEQCCLRASCYITCSICTYDIVFLFFLKVTSCGTKWIQQGHHSPLCLWIHSYSLTYIVLLDIVWEVIFVT